MVVKLNVILQEQKKYIYEHYWPEQQ